MHDAMNHVQSEKVAHSNMYIGAAGDPAPTKMFTPTLFSPPPLPTREEGAPETNLAKKERNIKAARERERERERE
jgi:hypothetical protein